MLNSKEIVKKIFNDLLELDFCIRIAYPAKYEQIVTRTADYLHQVTGREYLIEVAGAGHDAAESAPYVQVSLKDGSNKPAE